MRKVMLAGAVLLLSATSSLAAWEPGQFALGFVNVNAPIGGRYVINEKLALDAGLGFEDVSDVGSKFSLDLGVPISVHDGDKAHLCVRPGIDLTSRSLDNEPEGFDGSSLAITGALMVEVWVTNNFTVSAAHGIRIETDPSVIATQGGGWTGVGFMYYLGN